MKKIRKLTSFLIIITFLLLICTNNPNQIKNKFLNSISYFSNKTGLTKIKALGNLITDSELKHLKDSGITGVEYSFDSLYYPYYSYLSENEKSIYKQIYANANSLSTTFIPTTEISKNKINKVFESVYNDHPELFWLSNSYSYKYTSKGNCAQIILKFNETAQNINQSKELFENSANTIINGAKNLKTDYAKEKYVHDSIINLAKYDETASLNQSAYSALVSGKTVCAGYSRAFQYIMIKLEIPTFYCTGYSDGDHAWNIIKLDDGYYNVDLTWDDKNYISYTYFNLTDQEFSKTHKRTNLSINLPSCTATKYKYKKTTSNIKIPKYQPNYSKEQNNTKEYPTQNSTTTTNSEKSQNIEIPTNQTTTETSTSSNEQEETKNLPSSTTSVDNNEIQDSKTETTQ